jgi:hypothetical protein
MLEHARKREPAFDTGKKIFETEKEKQWEKNLPVP